MCGPPRRGRSQDQGANPNHESSAAAARALYARQRHKGEALIWVTGSKEEPQTIQYSCGVGGSCPSPAVHSRTRAHEIFLPRTHAQHVSVMCVPGASVYTPIPMRRDSDKRLRSEGGVNLQWRRFIRPVSLHYHAEGSDGVQRLSSSVLHTHTLRAPRTRATHTHTHTHHAEGSDGS